MSRELTEVPLELRAAALIAAGQIVAAGRIAASNDDSPASRFHGPPPAAETTANMAVEILEKFLGEPIQRPTSAS